MSHKCMEMGVAVVSITLAQVSDLTADPLNTIGKYGLTLGLIVFFIWRDWQRERDLTDRIRKLETYQRDVLAKIAVSSNAALHEVADTIKGCPARGPMKGE